jgi:hypothetical protein
MPNFNKTIGKRRADKIAADSAQDMLRFANEIWPDRSCPREALRWRLRTAINAIEVR